MLYYYLISQLPFLFYDQKAPMSSDVFKELAESLLNKKDAKLMKYLSLEIELDPAAIKPTGCDFIDNWRKWECTLRLNLARYRSLKLYSEVTETAEPPVIPADAYNAAAVAFTQEGSPYDGEILLDKARWAAIDLMAGNNYFDRKNVYAYYLKLLLLERRQLFNAEKGFAEYKSLYAEILKDSNNSQVKTDEEI